MYMYICIYEHHVEYSNEVVPFAFEKVCTICRFFALSQFVSAEDSPWHPFGLTQHRPCGKL